MGGHRGFQLGAEDSQDLLLGTAGDGGSGGKAGKQEGGDLNF